MNELPSLQEEVVDPRRNAVEFLFFLDRIRLKTCPTAKKMIRYNTWRGWAPRCGLVSKTVRTGCLLNSLFRLKNPVCLDPLVSSSVRMIVCYQNDVTSLVQWSGSRRKLRRGLYEEL